MALQNLARILAGELRHRVTVQQRISTRATTGEEIDNWTDVLTAWASVEPVSAQTRFAGAEFYPEANTLITMRFRPWLNATMRIVWHQLTGDRVYRILGLINVNEQNIELELACEEISPKRNA